MAFYGLFLATNISAQTCDLVLAGYTPSAQPNGIHQFVVQFPNAENCGCNEYTQQDGNSCEDSSNNDVQNNESVSHLVFGLHYIDEVTGEDLGENTDCTSTNFHPGWSYGFVVTGPPDGWQSGSATTIGINPPFSWECILNNPIEGYCWEVVIWQINYSQTATYEDFPDGWSAGNNFNGTQMYPDVDLSNNRIIFCPDPIITDTVYVNVYDTVYVDNYVYDTVFVDNYIYDTTFVDNYIYDTTFIDVIYFDTTYVDNYIYDTTYVDNYIYITDTLTEYVVQELWINCETGLPCDEEPPGIHCPDWSSIFIPNTFTPNNDGLNDVWKVIYDMDCWEYVEFEIFNRWGGRVFYGDTFWDGSVNGGSYYVADGVYTYVVKAKKYDRPDIIQKSGHITLFR